MRKPAEQPNHYLGRLRLGETFGCWQSRLRSAFASASVL
jgi:hypothetical protein